MAKGKPVVTWGMIAKIDKWAAKWRRMTVRQKANIEQNALRNNPVSLGDDELVSESMLSSAKDVV